MQTETQLGCQCIHVRLVEQGVVGPENLKNIKDTSCYPSPRELKVPAAANGPVARLKEGNPTPIRPWTVLVECSVNQAIPIPWIIVAIVPPVTVAKRPTHSVPFFPDPFNPLTNIGPQIFPLQ